MNSSINLLISFFDCLSVSIVAVITKIEAGAVLGSGFSPDGVFGA